AVARTARAAVTRLEKLSTVASPGWLALSFVSARDRDGIRRLLAGQTGAPAEHRHRSFTPNLSRVLEAFSLLVVQENRSWQRFRLQETNPPPTLGQPITQARGPGGWRIRMPR